MVAQLTSDTPPGWRKVLFWARKASLKTKFSSKESIRWGVFSPTVSVSSHPLEQFHCLYMELHQSTQFGHLLTNWCCHLDTHESGFSVLIAVKALHPSNPVSWAKFICNSTAMPHHTILALHLVLGKLCTQWFLQSKGWLLASKCPLCCHQEGSIFHLFWECNYSRWLWGVHHVKLRWKPTVHQSLRSAVEELYSFTRQDKGVERLASTSFCAMTYNIWEESNQHVFNNQQPSYVSRL